MLSGGKPLNEAYKTALQRKQASESGDEAMETLREKAPDLADLVIEERMELSEALAALSTREKNKLSNAIATINVYRDFISAGESISRESKHTLPLLQGMRPEIESRLGCTIKDAVQKIIRIDTNVLIQILEKVE